MDRHHDIMYYSDNVQLKKQVKRFKYLTNGFLTTTIILGVATGILGYMNYEGGCLEFDLLM
jgi:hypothetical protein